MRNLFKLCFMALCAFLALTLCSCNFMTKEEIVDFELPEWPEYLPELKGWKIQVFYDEALRQAQEPQGPQISGVAEALEAPPDTKIISFHLQKNRPCSIIARPITQNNFFKSAGTIYPYSKSISWSGGYAASLYKTAGQAADNFNWEKLMQTLEEKALDQEAFYNPWLLDTQEILEGIAYHNFTATKLKQNQTFCLELDFEVLSSYVPENDFMRTSEKPYVTVKKDILQLFALPQSSAYCLLISASSAKNISLEFISMPIYIEEI